MRPLLLLLLLLLAACGGYDGAADRGSGTDALTGADRPANDLVVEQELGDGSPLQRWTLVCAGTDGRRAEGDHPAAEPACAHLAGLDAPFAAQPADLLCTEVYGGPQTARVTGTWAAEPVDLALSRTDGCRIAQWDGLGPLLPGPVGVGGSPDGPQ